MATETTPKNKWNLGQWVKWENPAIPSSGDGIIKKAAYLPEDIPEGPAGWWYLLDNVWVFEDRITGEYLR